MKFLIRDGLNYRWQIGYKLSLFAKEIQVLCATIADASIKETAHLNAQFKCVSCGHVDNTDFNAHKNILAKVLPYQHVEREGLKRQQ